MRSTAHRSCVPFAGRTLRALMCRTLVFMALSGGREAGAQTPKPATKPAAKPATKPATTRTTVAARDSAQALAVFRENIAAIHTRNKSRYLATYVHTPQLVRHSPARLETGYEGWPAITENAWPDTLIVNEMRVVPVAPGVPAMSTPGAAMLTQKPKFDGVPAPGDTLTGVSTRVFVRTPDGMRITVTASWNDAAPVTKK